MVSILRFRAAPAHLTTPSDPPIFVPTAPVAISATLPNPESPQIVKTNGLLGPALNRLVLPLPNISFVASSHVNGLESSSAERTWWPDSRKSGPRSLLPLTKAPSQLRPLWATGDPLVAGASAMRWRNLWILAMSKFFAVFLSSMDAYLVSQARITNIPVEWTMASNGSFSEMPASCKRAR